MKTQTYCFPAESSTEELTEIVSTDLDNSQDTVEIVTMTTEAVSESGSTSPETTDAAGKRPSNGSAATRRRQNMLKLIEQLRTREMIADEIAGFLNFTQSGAHKYVQELRDAGVIELTRYVDSTSSYRGKAVYRLSPDPEKVRAFQAAIVQPKMNRSSKEKRSSARNEIEQQNLPGDTNGRRFHIMADDTHYTIRFHRAPAQRDPLVEALFGAPKSARTEAKPEVSQE